MNVFTDIAISIAFEKEHAVLTSLREGDDDEIAYFRRWVRSRRVREVPQIFEIIQKTVLACRFVAVSPHTWDQFKQWRHVAYPSSINSDTITSIYFTFVNWNKHNIPRRHARRACSTLDIHQSTFTPIQPERNDVIDQHIRQAAPTLRIPRRCGNQRLCVNRPASALEARKLEKEDLPGLAVIASDF
jgi:hypothetical protein